MEERWIGACITLLVAAVLVGTFWWEVKRGGEFHKVCEQQHGVVVFDGRQKVCLKEAK